MHSLVNGASERQFVVEVSFYVDGVVHASLVLFEVVQRLPVVYAIWIDSCKFGLQGWTPLLQDWLDLWLHLPFNRALF